MRLLRATLCGAILTACSAHAPSLHGTVLTPAPPARSFVLTDQNGRPFSLASLRGGVTALYFGFTHCKDVCPQTLSLLNAARAQSGIDPRRVHVVMISVDPDRDSPAALRGFFARRHVQANGLTGTAHDLRAVYKAYGIAIESRRDDILHTDSVFVIGPSLRIQELLDPATPPALVADDLRAVLR